MDQRNEFSKWMQAVEEALSDEKKEIAESMPVAGNECGCGSWDCPQCFPEQDQAPGGATPVVLAVTGCPACGQGAAPQPEVCPACGQPHENQDGQLSPMSIPPQGEIETEVPMEPMVDPMKYQMGMSGMDEEEPFFDGELEENEPEVPGTPASTQPPVDRTPSNGKPGVKLGHITQKFEPLGGADEEGEDSPLTYGEDNLDENDYDDRGPSDEDLASIENSTDPMVNPMHANQDIDAIMYMQSSGLSMSDTQYDERELYTLSPEQLQQVKAEVMGGQQAPVAEDDMMSDPNMGGMQGQAPMPTGGTASGTQPSSGGGAGNYAPGTAPTMPESIQQGKRTMENIDSDIARVLKGFTKYDELKASKAIVSEKKGGKPSWLEDKEKDAEKKEGKKVDEEGNPWAKGGSKSEEADDKKETKTSKGGTVTKTETGLKHKGTYGGEKKDVKESTSEVDPEVLEWMQRFSKLGKMTGYGR